jgi:hypothetical protein
MNNLTDIYFRLQQSFIKEGQRSYITKQIDTGLLSLQITTKRPITLLLSLFLFNTNIFIEAKTKIMFEKKIIAPAVITFNRRLFLIFKWFGLSLTQAKQKTNFLNKFVKEFLLVTKNEKCETLNFRVWNNVKSSQNRANAHYRW